MQRKLSMITLDRSRLTRFQKEIRVLSDDELIGDYNTHVRIGSIQSHEHAVYLLALHQRFLMRFGVSPIYYSMGEILLTSQVELDRDMGLLMKEHNAPSVPLITMVNPVTEHRAFMRDLMHIHPQTVITEFNAEVGIVAWGNYRAEILADLHNRLFLINALQPVLFEYANNLRITEGSEVYMNGTEAGRLKETNQLVHGKENIELYLERLGEFWNEFKERVLIHRSVDTTVNVSNLLVEEVANWLIIPKRHKETLHLDVTDCGKLTVLLFNVNGALQSIEEVDGPYNEPHFISSDVRYYIVFPTRTFDGITDGQFTLR